MLVLTRRPEESIVITCPNGEVIKILITEIKGEKVRLAFDAARNITIHRTEVQEAIKHANRNS